jgi:hypothetical protein
VEETSLVVITPGKWSATPDAAGARRKIRRQTLGKGKYQPPVAALLGRVWRPCLTFVLCGESTPLWRIRNRFWLYRATIGA